MVGGHERVEGGAIGAVSRSGKTRGKKPVVGEKLEEIFNQPHLQRVAQGGYGQLAF